MATKTAAPPKTDSPFYKFFNINQLSRVTKIQSDKIYNNLKNYYASFLPDEIEAMAKALIPPITALFERLGYTVTFKKK